MRIGINLLLLQPRVGGVSNYVLTLLRNWPLLYPDDKWVLFTFPDTLPLEDLLPAAVRTDRRLLKDQQEILKHLRDIDVFFCPFGSLAPRPTPLPSVLTLVDVQERFFPAFFQPQDIANRLYHFDSSLRMADRVITISGFSRRSMVELVGVPERKMRVIPLCPDLLPEETQRPASLQLESGSFAFYPANDWPHKNHLHLLEALARLKQEGLRVDCVWTGGRGEYADLLQKQCGELGLTDQVTHLGQVTRPEMSWLYRNARCLVFPSLFEGFGIPLVEAMASGLPIVCSGTTSLPEVAGEAALYFDPENIAHMSARIRDIWTDDALRNRLRLAGQERGARFTPHALVEQHRKVFQEAINSYRTWRFWRQQMLEWPWTVMFRKTRIPARQLTLARSMMQFSSTTSPEGLL